MTISSDELKELLAKATDDRWVDDDPDFRVEEAAEKIRGMSLELAADNIALQAEVERLHEIVEDLEEKLRQERDALKTMKPLW